MTLIEEINERNYQKVFDKENPKTQAKFDYIKGFEKLNAGSVLIKEKWGRAMRDPTMWAYAYLKDKEGNPLKIYPFQDKLINDPHRLIIGAAANQIGKTLCMCVKALHHACYMTNAFVVIVSRSADQATRILDEIKWMMRFGRLSFDEMKDEVDNRMELHIKSKGDKGVAVIKCIPPTTSILGIPATLIINDEVGFWEIKNFDPVNYFYQVLETRTNTTKNWKHDFLTPGQIICISNPNGKQGLLWHLWNKDKRFNKYSYSWLAKPTNLLDEWKEKKDTLPSDIFDSSYAAVFSSSAGAFITPEEIDEAVRVGYKVEIPKGSQLFLGGDFAGEDTHSRSVDLTALIGVVRVKDTSGMAKVRMVYYNVFPQRTKKSVVYDEIERLCQSNAVNFAYDKVGVGDSVKNDLIQRHVLSEPQIHSLTYSLPNKSEVYWNLKHLFEQKKIELYELPALREELSGLQFQKTGGGWMTNGIMQSYIKVHHSSEKIHDDIADSLANACYIATQLGVPDYEYKWIPQSKENVRDYVKKTQEMMKKRVMCSHCGYDWDLGTNDSCIGCSDTNEREILDYCTEKPIKI